MIKNRNADMSEGNVRMMTFYKFSDLDHFAVAMPNPVLPDTVSQLKKCIIIGGHRFN